MSNAILDDINKTRDDLFTFWRSLYNSIGAMSVSMGAVEQVHDAYKHLCVASIMFERNLSEIEKEKGNEA